MKIILYVFSGTGNTLKVASLYRKYLKDAEVKVYRIAKSSPPPPPAEDYDMIGLGYPIHAFSAPEPILKFAKSLPEAENKPAFVFKTSGEGLHLNDGSSQKLIGILKKKGYLVRFERHFVMPYNMIYRHTDEMAKQMYIYAKAMADLSCREIESGISKKVKKNAFKRAFTAVFRVIEQPFAHIHGPLFKADKKKCINCEKCIKICPQSNIKVKDGKIKFGTACVLCMGCAFNCPTDAIGAGLFRFWKVNGSYRLDELVKDDSLCFPVVPDRAKGIYRLYKKYYRECDRELEKNGISVKDYI